MYRLCANFAYERMIEIIAITEEEKKAICAKYPHVHVARTAKAKTKRHRYYMVEGDSPAMQMLRRLRAESKDGVNGITKTRE